MSISIPSKEICAADVPEVNNLKATFQYNFFTKDEKIVDNGGIPKSVLSRPGGEIDSEFIQFASTRAPRMVLLSWKAPKLTTIGNGTSDINIRNNRLLSNTQNGSLIRDNIDSVISEENFTSDTFTNVTFCDGDIDSKLYSLVSGSFVLQTMNENVDSNIMGNKAAQVLSTLTPRDVSPQFLAQALTSQNISNGTKFYSQNNNDAKEIVNSYFKTMKDVFTNVQINNKFLHDLTNKAVIDPNSPFSSDMDELLKQAKQKKAIALQNSMQLSENDYKSFVPFIDIKAKKSSLGTDNSGAEIVGYIIDKFEILQDGSIIQQTPIIVDNSYANLTVDFKVKYDATYAYAIRTIAVFNIPAVDNDTDDVAVIKILVSSKPSNKVFVKTFESVSPPVPSDISFTWNYERVNPRYINNDYIDETTKNNTTPGSLMIHWTFPPNPQRDIKKFQVFRRKSINHPFELIKVYDFDDSSIKSKEIETPNRLLIEYLTSPCTFFYDDDFDSLNKKSYIYAIASVDAHGYSSGYSAQFEVWFDQFKNKLEKKLISHQGAPKQYPNFYLSTDTFVDTIKISGPNSKKMKIYFNPEFYYIVDDKNRLEKAFETKQTGGSYKLSFINIDNQKQAMISINIDDRRTNVQQQNEQKRLSSEQQEKRKINSF